MRTLPPINPCKQRIFTIPKVLKGPPILGIPFLGIFSPSKEGVLRMGFSLYQGDIDKLKRMVDYIYLDMTDKLEDHAES